MIKTDEQLEAMLNKAIDMKNFDGMTYKEGVIAALEWVLGYMDENDDPTQ